MNVTRVHVSLFIQVHNHGELDGISVDNEFESADYFGANVQAATFQCYEVYDRWTRCVLPILVSTYP